MGSEHLPLRQSGIYHNLPTFDPSLTGLRAIVCGASGISGFHCMLSLLDTPDRWSRIYAVSRKPVPDPMMRLLTPEQRSRIQHVPVDLQSSADDIAESFKQAGVEADYVFFFSYVEPHTEDGTGWMQSDALIKLNVPMFQHLLDALPLANVRPRRILLQTGLKHYGMQAGPVRTPMVESDPRPEQLGPNFYYGQEDSLIAYCKTHPETGWNVVRPGIVVGATTYASNSAFRSFPYYATVQAHKNEPLVFGGDFRSWQNDFFHSTARLTGYLSEWAVLEDKCRNQAFNAHDDTPFSLNRFFAELARWYGVEKGVLPPEEDPGKFTSIKSAAGERTALGYGPPWEWSRSYTLADWARKPENKTAWGEIIKKEGIKTPSPFVAGNVGSSFIGDFIYLDFGGASMTKAKKLGWTGFVDTTESVFEMYQQMSQIGESVPLKV